MDILYYSNYCPHSQKVLQTLVKGNMSDKISFICIDKRVQDPKTNQTYIILELYIFTFKACAIYQKVVQIVREIQNQI